MVPIIDVILLIILFGFIFYGFFFGLIRNIGLFVGVLLGAVLASRLYLGLFNLVEPMFWGYNNLGKVLVFMFLFTLIHRLTGIGFYLIEKSFNLLSIIPFLKTINRLSGAFFGFLTGSFSIGLVLFVVSRYAILEHWFGQLLVVSKLAPFFLKVNNILLPLLPKVLTALKSLI